MNPDNTKVLLSEVSITIDMNLGDSVVNVRTIFTNAKNADKKFKLSLSKFSRGGGGVYILLKALQKNVVGKIMSAKVVNLMKFKLTRASDDFLVGRGGLRLLS